MIDFSKFDRRPILIAVAGSNGAGKTTFYKSHLVHSGLRWVNADVLAAEFQCDPYDAAAMAEALRKGLLARGESFVFETVFSDPAGAKLGFLKEAEQAGYMVVLCFIGIDSPEQSEERVALRVSQGEHDVPTDKIYSRFPRTLENLRAAITQIPHVLVYDNSDFNQAFRPVAVFEAGKCVERADDLPAWLAPLVG